MKKAYIAPATGVYNIDCVTNIMSASGATMTISNTTVNTSEGDQLGREENSVSNVWDSEW